MSSTRSPTKFGYLAIQAALQQGTQLLAAANIEVPRLTAEVLLCHALQRDRTFLYTHSTDPLTQLAWIHYGRYLHERIKGKPTQYITHRQEFYGRDFYVDERVLIPRPETEHLVEAAIAYCKQHNPGTVLDVGTGSGAIAVTIALECQRTVLASDISAPALNVAKRNRQAAAVHFFQSNLLTALAPHSVHLLVSNPPYIAKTEAAEMQPEVRDWEPHSALFAEGDGFEVYRHLIQQSENVLPPNGCLMLELGYRSLQQVRDMLAPRWGSIQVFSDLAGISRVIVARFVA